MTKQATRIAAAVAAALDKQRTALDRARGLRQVRIVVRVRRDGEVDDVLLSQETSSTYGREPETLEFAKKKRGRSLAV